MYITILYYNIYECIYLIHVNIHSLMNTIFNLKTTQRFYYCTALLILVRTYYV